VLLFRCLATFIRSCSHYPSRKIDGYDCRWFLLGREILGMPVSARLMAPSISMN